jgi:hypothetical protein
MGNIGCKVMRKIYSLDLLEAFPLYTRDIEGSPMNELYNMLSRRSGDRFGSGSV